MLKTLDTSIISFIILLIIGFHSYKRSERIFIQYKLFFSLIILNMTLIIIDILGWVFNGLPGTANYFFNKGFNLILYIFVPMAPTTWVLYTYYFVFHDDQKVRKIRSILYTFLLINAVMSVISLYTGWYFSVDFLNIYHRGNLFFIHLAYCSALIIYSLIFIWTKRNLIQKKQFYSIMLFFIPQAVGTAMQIKYYGVSYNWSGMMISLLIIYFNIQLREMNTDYLTGVNNRPHLERYIKAKIRKSSDKKTFGAIMIDIDNFKAINDKFGHAAGDEALKITAEILSSSLKGDGFIARFGGDEFIVVSDAGSIRKLEETAKRIMDNADNYNINSNKPYSLHFSLGYDIYDIKSKMNSNDFIIHIDRLMYNNKKNKNSHLKY